MLEIFELETREIIQCRYGKTTTLMSLCNGTADLCLSFTHMGKEGFFLVAHLISKELSHNIIIWCFVK